MCTVTYLPGPEGAYTFTSNRDEQAARSPKELSQISTDGGLKLYLPKDTGGGSWIVLSEDGRLACLLNGAFERHERHLPYRRSRGLVVLDFFSYANGREFWEQYDFDNIEPFTLITVETNYRIEGRWDGLQVHLRHFPKDIPQIWASATLYTTEMRQERQHWWDHFLASGLKFTPAEVLNFHLTAGDGDPATNLRMSRPQYGVETVSVSQVVAQNETFQFDYHDLLSTQMDQILLKIEH